MASFISALSLFILVLSNGCFTLPITDEQFSSSTFSSLNDDLTTEQTFNLRLLPDDDTSVLPDIDHKRSIDEHMGFVEMTTSVDGLSEEKTAQALRTFDEFSTSEPMTFTTEQSLNNTRDHDDLSLTTVEPITQVTEFERRGFINEFENETETKNNTQEMQIELTTIDMLSFTLTSSAVAPKFYTSESSTSTLSTVTSKFYTSESSVPTSTEKYTGLLKDENEHDEEPELSTKHMKTLRKVTPKSEEQEPEQSTKYMKIQRKTTPKSEEPEHESEPEQSTKYMKIQRKATSTRKSEVQSEEESTVPIAVFDQEVLSNVPNVPNDFMILDENNDIVVTDLPDKFSTSTNKTEKEQKSLNQGKKIVTL